MMEQIVFGVVLAIVAVVFFAALGCRRVTPPTEQAPARLTDVDRVDDDEGWIPLSLGPVSGQARIRQGGKIVGYAPMYRLHLPPGWEAGPKGMRPYTR